jgi:ABC-type nitrate/sulfonate/bicarbonate transport system substrate-binding protein
MAAAATIGAGGLLAACGDDDESTTEATSGSGETTTTSPTPTKLTVMMPFPLSVNFLGDIVAKSAGFMDDAGIDLDLQFATGAPAALQQLAAGNVTVIRNGPVETIQAIVDEDAPFITIGMPNQRTNYVLASMPDAPLGLGDLSGRTVGLPSLGGNAEFTLDLLLREAGVDPAQVQRQAVGLEASSYALLQEGVIDAMLVVRSTIAAIKAMGENPTVDFLEDVNPLLGTNLVTTTEFMEERRDPIVAYLKGLHAAMLALNDPAKVPDLIAAVQADDWDLPQLADPDAAKAIVASVASRWFEDGEENLLRNIPERWEEGVAELIEQGVVPAGTEATDLYTNDLLDEALA